ncbi:hypothetical protein IFM89_018423 [Coptis chinensis]|uniref:Prolamin-like domain-containing protein n=1 Tax=Coptis chinensis TaxID=261450 RepID=A0A835LIF9_9MAGN|nr:hypothetical protein IFM89_018423 [Coptis chinensis]
MYETLFGNLACCKVITDITTSCWPKLFPFITSSFPLLLTRSCTKAPDVAPSIATARIPLLPLVGTLPFPLLPGQDIQQCMPSFQSVNGCLVEIFASSVSGRVGQLGVACCKAITEIKTICWPKLFPLINPSFPPLLMNNCDKVLGVAPSFAPIPKGATTKINESDESNVETPTVAFAPSDTY